MMGSSHLSHLASCMCSCTAVCLLHRRDKHPPDRPKRKTEMLEKFDAIKNDPRSGTGVFRGLKRNTTYSTGEYCTYTWRSFGASAEGTFVTVPQGAIGNKAFILNPSTSSYLDYHPLWGGLYFLEEIGSSQGPWETAVQDLYEPDIDTDSYIISQTDSGMKIWRPIERDNEFKALSMLMSFGGTIDVYETTVFNMWLSKQSGGVQNAVRYSQRTDCEAKPWRPAYVEIAIPDPRVALFGQRGKDSKNWVDNIQRIG
nr:MAG TPA: hypothetical protein [Caudoviricetes sp.]